MKGFSYAYWYNHALFFTFESICDLHYVFWNTYIEPFTHSWTETNLIKMIDIFNVLLNSI